MMIVNLLEVDMASAKAHRLKPISLYPLTVDQVAAVFMSMDGREIDKRLKRRGIVRPKSK